MQPYQERVVQEKQELEEKITNLEAFIGTDTFDGLPAQDQILLSLQYHIMVEYAKVLRRRIALFEDAPVALHCPACDSEDVTKTDDNSYLCNNCQATGEQSFTLVE